MHLSDRGRLVARTRDRPGPELPWLGNEGRLKSIRNWLRTYQGIDLDGQVNQKREEQGQTQEQAPVIRTNGEDYYQVRPMDSVATPSQQRLQTRPTLRDSSTNRTTVEPQEKNVRPGDYIQIRSRPADRTAEARKKYESPDPWRQSWRRTLDQVSS